jgi:hypothetical protein
MKKSASQRTPSLIPPTSQRLEIGAKEASKTPEIPAAINRLSQATERLQENLQGMADRLISVVVPSVGATETKDVMQSNSELAIAIDKQTALVDAANQHLINLLAALSLAI